MKFKILTPDEDGLFRFTKEELEKLMDEVYEEGYKDAMLEHNSSLTYAPGVRQSRFEEASNPDLGIRQNDRFYKEIQV